MDEFLTWETLMSYVNFVSIVFMVVEFTKEMKYVKAIPTKYWSFFIAFVLFFLLHLNQNTFQFKDILLYFFDSIGISLGSNGLSDLNVRREVRNER